MLSCLSRPDHVIPAKAGTQFVLLTCTPAFAGVTTAVIFISPGGRQAHANSIESQWGRFANRPYAPCTPACAGVTTPGIFI
jgi:hypothetical protein